MSRKLERLLTLLRHRAFAVAGPYRHAAALVRNGRIVAIATNSPYCHAEEAVLRLLPRKQVQEM